MAFASSVSSRHLWSAHNITLGIVLCQFLLPSLHAQSAGVGKVQDEQSAADLQKVVLSFAQLKQDGKLPGLKTDDKGGELNACELSDQTQKEPWFVDTGLALHLTGKARFYLVDLRFKGSSSKYVFKLEETRAPELIVVCRRDGTTWRKLWEQKMVEASDLEGKARGPHVSTIDK